MASSIVAAATSADNKDDGYMTIDPDTGKTRVIDALHDDAWVREVGGGFGSATIEFLPDNKRVWFLSERDGWMHLYTLDLSAENAKPKQLTEGKWEITAADLSQDGRTFYITSTEAHPGERNLYRSRLRAVHGQKSPRWSGRIRRKSLPTVRRLA